MIKLCPLEEEHLEKMIKWRMSPTVDSVSLTSPKLTIEKQRKWFKNVLLDNTKEYFVIKYKDIEIGVAYIFDINRINNACSTGWYIGEEKYLLTGVGVIIEFKVLEYVFDKLKINRLYGKVMSNNKKVIRMHKNFGFTEEGILREAVFKNNHYYNIHYISMLKSEWINNKKKNKKIYEIVYNIFKRS